jgi:hypothetical protein
VPVIMASFGVNVLHLYIGLGSRRRPSKFIYWLYDSNLGAEGLRTGSKADGLLKRRIS